MNQRQTFLVSIADKHRQLVLDAERWLWAHPQTGYTEWDAHHYLVEKYEALGYQPVLAGKLPGFGDIPGFYVDADTGREGPVLAVFGELDALDIANHPESVNGMTHCCGHHAQSAALLGLAAALKEDGALDGLCGKIRLIAVPAEELIQLAFREELRKKGVITYMGGKTEFMHRGILDGVDLALMVHGTSAGAGEPYDFSCTCGSNGFIAKTIRYKGISALAGAALAMGAGVELTDRPGYAPEHTDRQFMKLVEQCYADLVGADRVNFDYDYFSPSSSDFGDITSVMPGVQFSAAGAAGAFHGIDFRVSDPDRLCLNAVRAQLFVIDALLKDDGSAARKIVADYEPEYPSIPAYLEAINDLVLDLDAVVYDEDGNAEVRFR